MDIQEPALQTLVDRLSGLPQVVAIGIGGSRASGMADPLADYDVYVFTTGPVPQDLRREIAGAFDPAAEIGNDWWGEGDYWSGGDVALDVMFWNRDEFEASLRRVIREHRPAVGYTTAFWFTMRHLQPIADRDGWLAHMKDLADAPYPDALTRAIVDYNHPLLRGIRTSYRAQIDLAIQRHDPVSVNHRIAAFLASAFDIIFAVTRTLHPGEKRQLTWMSSLGEAIPPELDGHIRDLILAQGDPSYGMVLPALDAVADDIDRLIHALA